MKRHTSDIGALHSDRSSRRRFLLGSMAALAAALPAGCGLGRSSLPRSEKAPARDASPAATFPTRPPNILLIIADDWSYPHTGVDGMTVVPTPEIDRLAGQGARFTRAFVCSPSCSPSRAGILTGQTPNRLGTGARLSGPLSDEHPRYTDLLAAAGYHIGSTGKGYAPAWLDEQRQHKAGKRYPNFAAFLEARPAGAPFCFWFGSNNPHRPYDRQVTERRAVDPAAVPVPPFLPDTPEVRADLADYYAEVAQFDAEVASLLELLERTGEADNTLVVVCSDNGMPFPRAKTNLYDAGTHSPLIVRWPQRIRAGQVVDRFVNLADLAPTFLAAAGQPIPPQMNAVNLLPLVAPSLGPAEPTPAGATVTAGRDGVFLVREQHVPHADGGGYSSRAIRTADYLYVLNLDPDRWPAGPPDQVNRRFPHGFVDVDEANAPGDAKQVGSGAKSAVVAAFHRGERLGKLALDKRPAEELYHLPDDPDQLRNIATDPRHAPARQRLAEQLRAWMQAAGDPAA